ncbi:hypothetical protein ACLOJK_007730 [Asimina triloba]
MPLTIRCSITFIDADDDDSYGCCPTVFHSGSRWTIGARQKNGVGHLLQIRAIRHVLSDVDVVSTAPAAAIPSSIAPTRTIEVIQHAGSDDKIIDPSRPHTDDDGSDRHHREHPPHHRPMSYFPSPISINGRSRCKHRQDLVFLTNPNGCLVGVHPIIRTSNAPSQAAPSQRLIEGGPPKSCKSGAHPYPHRWPSVNPLPWPATSGPLISDPTVHPKPAGQKQPSHMKHVTSAFTFPRSHVEASEVRCDKFMPRRMIRELPIKGRQAKANTQHRRWEESCGRERVAERRSGDEEQATHRARRA